MSPERWKQVEELFHAALAQEPAQRSTFIASASNGDEELRREVERLLAQNGSLDERLERPAWEGASISSESTVHRLSPGVELGPYRIEGPLGAGGMGQVYKARDTRLGRQVAIKVVAEEFSNRFEREARAISGLNHLHICTLYDVGPGYLVMELVEGETLAARLKQGRLPMEMVLRYGAQIADALAAAHAKGIIHRDLKPANLMVTRSGIEVLDFGLARITQPDETMTASRVIQGTPAYMAPEQSEGKPCDARTDIYALGLVLYEMATGKRLKQDEPPALNGFPERVGHVIERCLAKEPDDRWQSARDVKRELEWAATRPAQSRTPQRTSRWTLVATAVATALVCAGSFAVVFALWSRGSRPVVQYPAHFTLSFAELELKPFGVPRPSPDGHYFAFVARGEQEQDALWLRPLDSVDARMLPGTEGAMAPFWSPDGRWIGFHASGTLEKISPDGGFPRTIAALSTLIEAAWGANGDILYRPGNRTPLYRIHESGGPSRQVTKLDPTRTENSHRSPVFLPDGRRFLFTTRCGQREHSAVYIGSLDSPAVRPLISVSSNVKYVPARGGVSNLLLYYRDSMLVAQQVDAEREKLAGDPMPVTGDVAYSPVAAVAEFDVAAVGNLVILRPASATARRLTWFSRSGAEIGVTGPRGHYEQPRLSPRGDRIAFNRSDEQTGNRDTWSIEIARGVSARLTTHEANDWFPVWSPDGKRMVFGSDREGAPISLPT